MCGITGWVDWDRDLSLDRPILEKMTATLAKRGPDASGFWLATQAALGHRRLVVVDPVGGGQPMVRNLGPRRFIIVYNGELYNTPEVRQELEKRGHIFESNSDTEALLRAYMEWGPDCLGRLNGIFAFGVWDEAAERLFLARDRLGVKPLFYAPRNDGLIFASELKALLAHPEIQPAVDCEGLGEVLALGPARSPGHGVFRGVRELKPGHCLIFNRQGLKKYRYWALVSQPHQDNLEDTAARVREILQDAAQRQLVADVPVCTLLSGGLDSSALSALAAHAYREAGGEPLRTFSIDFVDNERYYQPNKFQPNSDAPWIKQVSEFLGTTHHNFIADIPQMVEALDIAMQARDLPGMADIDSSLYLFCREIKTHATVAISGECSDEIFGGYPWFRDEVALNCGTFPWAQERSWLRQFFTPEVINYVNPEDYVAARYRETLNEVPQLPGEDLLAVRRRELFYLNLTWFMTNLLDRKDRMSMATGLEVRVPFCDHRLVEYVWNIPWEMKTSGDQEKGILRLALKGLLPDDVLSRKKSPYPKTHNPAYLEAVRSRLLTILNDSSSPLRDLILPDVVRDFATSSAATFSLPWFGQLMAGPQLLAYLIQLNNWLRDYHVVIK